MCGVFGFIGREPFSYEKIKTIAVLAEKRGMHSFGYVCDGQYYRVLGKASDNLDKIPKSGQLLIGHCRLATFGSPTNINQCQPFFNGSIGVCHNGNIYNYKSIVSSYHIEASSGSDSEVLIRLLEHDQVINYTDIFSIIEDSPGAFVFLIESRIVLVSKKLPIWKQETSEGVYFCSVKFSGATKINFNIAHEFSFDGLEAVHSL